MCGVQSIQQKFGGSINIANMWGFNQCSKHVRGRSIQQTCAGFTQHSKHVGVQSIQQTCAGFNLYSKHVGVQSIQQTCAGSINIANMCGVHSTQQTCGGSINIANMWVGVQSIKQTCAGFNQYSKHVGVQSVQQTCAGDSKSIFAFFLFLQRRMSATRYFFSIEIENRENTYNYIVRADFNQNSKSSINLSPLTVFQMKAGNLIDMFQRSKQKV